MSDLWWLWERGHLHQLVGEVTSCCCLKLFSISMAIFVSSGLHVMGREILGLQHTHPHPTWMFQCSLWLTGVLCQCWRGEGVAACTVVHRLGALERVRLVSLKTIITRIGWEVAAGMWDKVLKVCWIQYPSIRMLDCRSPSRLCSRVDLECLRKGPPSCHGVGSVTCSRTYVKTAMRVKGTIVHGSWSR